MKAPEYHEYCEDSGAQCAMCANADHERDDGTPICLYCLDGSQYVHKEGEGVSGILLPHAKRLQEFCCGSRTVKVSRGEGMDNAGVMSTVTLKCVISRELDNDDDARQHVELHEAVHAMDSVFGLGFDEDKTEAVASAFLQFLRTAKYE